MTPSEREEVKLLLMRMYPYDGIAWDHCHKGGPNLLICTRTRGHDGPHVAHGGAGKVLDFWNDPK